MDLFEILFIALFLLFPILEQVLRKNRGEPDSEEPDPGAPQEHGEPGQQAPERKPVKAAEMVPDDLWAVLTGEQRPAEGVGWEEEEVEGQFGDSWSEEPDEARRVPEPVATPEVDSDWDAPAPGSREYRGPEAYSLERLDQEAVSLESPLQSSEARHRRFHEIIDAQPVRRRTRRSAVGRAIRTPAGIRQAFVLSEVLGTPKGLED